MAEVAVPSSLTPGRLRREGGGEGKERGMEERKRKQEKAGRNFHRGGGERKASVNGVVLDKQNYKY